MKATRIQSFSDGVFAILITLLVLEFKLPEYQQGGLAKAVLAQWPTMLAYVVTYAYVGILWLFHHDLFDRITRVTPRLNVLNLGSLFLTTLLSYSMSLLAKSLSAPDVPDVRFAVCAYDALALSISLSYLFIYRYLSRTSCLSASSGPSSGYSDRMRRYPPVSIGLYASSFVAAFASVYVSLAFLAAGIAYHGYAYWRSSD